jgi:hypothetical protein
VCVLLLAPTISQRHSHALVSAAAMEFELDAHGDIHRRLAPLATYPIGEQCDIWPQGNITPYRYDMFNGPTTGVSGNYIDSAYGGLSLVSTSTSPGFQVLTLGSGELTDGTIAQGNWNNGGASIDPDYMGWYDDSVVNSDGNNFKVGVDFYFDPPIEDAGAIEVVTFYFSDGDESNNVCAPSAVYVEGVEYDFESETANVLEAMRVDVYLDTPFVGQSLHVDMEQTRGSPCRWIFASEIQFNRCTPELPTAAPTKSSKKSRRTSSSSDEAVECPPVTDGEITPYLEYVCGRLFS